MEVSKDGRFFAYSDGARTDDRLYIYSTQEQRQVYTFPFPQRISPVRFIEAPAKLLIGSGSAVHMVQLQTGITASIMGTPGWMVYDILILNNATALILLRSGNEAEARLISLATQSTIGIYKGQAWHTLFEVTDQLALAVGREIAFIDLVNEKQINRSFPGMNILLPARTTTGQLILEAREEINSLVRVGLFIMGPDPGAELRPYEFVQPVESLGLTLGATHTECLLILNRNEYFDVFCGAGHKKNIRIKGRSTPVQAVASEDGTIVAGAWGDGRITLHALKWD